MQDDKAEIKYITLFLLLNCLRLFCVFKIFLFNLLLLLLTPSVFCICCSDEKTEAEIYLLNILKKINNTC